MRVNVSGKRNVRVLSLFPSLDPAGGGIQSGGAHMVLASSRAGVEHVVSCSEQAVAQSRSQQLIGRLQQEGIDVVPFPALDWPAELAKRWSISPAQVPWIWRQAAHFDLVHVHGVWNIGALAGLGACRGRSVPIVVTPHESLTATDIDSSRSRARRGQKLALKSLYLRWADLFIITSELETKQSIPADAPHETIPYPLYDSRHETPLPGPRGTTQELAVGYLGRIAPKKNIPVLIEALGRLPDHIRLLIAGDGPDEIVVAARARAKELGLGDRVEWLGFVPPDARGDFLDRIDLLAMPSSFESFGMAAAEAMLAGVPLVVSERTGISEVLAHRGGGVVIKPEPDSLAAAVLELDRNRTRLTELGAEAQRAIQHELDYDRVGARLLEAYLRVLGARDGGVKTVPQSQ